MNFECTLTLVVGSLCLGGAVWLSCHWIFPPVRNLLEQPVEPLIVRAGELGIDERRLRERLLLIEVSWGAIVLLASWKILGFLLGATLLGMSIHLRGWVLARLVARQEKLLRTQIMDFTNRLDGLQSSSKTLPQSLNSLAGVMPPPLGPYLASIVLEDKRGRPLAESLGAAAQRMKLEEFSLLAATVRCALRHNSPLKKYISGVRETLSNRQQADQQLHSRTSTARSNIRLLLCCPALTLGVMCLLVPKGVALLFTETVGQLVFVSIAWFIYIGVIWGRGILNIR